MNALEAAVSGQFKASETCYEGRGESVRVNLQYIWFDLFFHKERNQTICMINVNNEGGGGQDLFGQCRNIPFATKE